MKSQTKANLLRALALCAGAAGFLLRFLLYTEGMDEKGLLITGHWSAVSLWIFTGVILLAFFLATRSLSGPEAYEDSFPGSPLRALGALLGAVGFALLAFRGLRSAASGLEFISLLLNILAALCLSAIAMCRLLRRKPFFLLHAGVCLAFALMMICRYRSWNSEPQVHNYCFYMAACVCLMLSSYQLAAFDAGIGSHGALWFWGLSAACLCLLASYGSKGNLPVFFWGIWAFTNLSNLTVQPRRQRKQLDYSGNTPETPDRGEPSC